MTPKEAFDRLSQIFKVTRIENGAGGGITRVKTEDTGYIHIAKARFLEPIEWGDATFYEPPKWRPATEADVGKDARFFSPIGDISHLGKLELMSIQVRVGGRSVFFKPEELTDWFSKCEVCE